MDGVKGGAEQTAPNQRGSHSLPSFWCRTLPIGFFPAAPLFSLHSHAPHPSIANIYSRMPR